MFSNHPDENKEANMLDRTCKSSGRDLRAQKAEGRKPRKVKEEKKVAVKPWLDIFQAGKIVVSMNPRNFENTELMIRHAQQEFLDTVGYASEDILGMPFDIVLGQASIRLNTYRMQNAILTGKSACEYNNLYRRDGVMLSCHLTIQSITGSASSTNEHREKWAVITVRSASVVGKLAPFFFLFQSLNMMVGNSKQNGVGLLGIDRIPASVLENTIGHKQH